jgi:hypothetical protein
VATTGIPLDETIMTSGGHVQRARGQLEWPVLEKVLYASGGGEYQAVDSPVTRLFFGEQYIVEYLDDAERGLRDRVTSRFRDIVRDASRIAVNSQNVDEDKKPEIDKGHFWAADVAANAIFAKGFGASLHYRKASSQEDAGDLGTGAIPFMPAHLAVGSVTWVNPHRIYLFTRLVYRSERCFSHLSDEYACSEIVPAGTTWGGGGSWETRSRHFAIEATFSDVHSVLVAPQFTVSAKVRR